MRQTPKKLTMVSWEPGNQIILRCMWGSRVRAVWPVTVIRDQPDLLATYLPKGTVFKRAVTLEGNVPRLPIGEWNLGEAVWTRDTVVLAFPKKPYRLLVFWDEEGKSITNWYANLEKPLERHEKGYDFTDLFLDVVISSDLADYRWKDEDELEEAVHVGLVTKNQVEDIRRAGNEVLRLVSTKSPPFSDGWENWKPSPDWPIPRL